MVDIVRGNFGQLDGFAQQLLATINQIQSEMDQMAQAAGITGSDWTDSGGGQFGDVHQAWKQVSEQRQQLVEQIRAGVQNTNSNLQTALQQSIARIGSTSIG
ncbi:hypothetical protein M8C13_40590 [Crossiella sp. SN42]|uniref:WXG100 family type VII secretion target n=1 Tax=unclassified Crossiella TaxID=2620835 RepID=UPI00207CA67A|nr:MULTISPECIES: hypothetical protein [unclassified Crossiella]MCO1582065.1 hypothetical protein [Crossiella sp. SN42]WHT18015.1 hypothetical protein N8J89_33620 [Crossiella sp. CA-258035]